MAHSIPQGNRRYEFNYVPASDQLQRQITQLGISWAEVNSYVSNRYPILGKPFPEIFENLPQLIPTFDRILIAHNPKRISEIPPITKRRIIISMGRAIKASLLE